MNEYIVSVRGATDDGVDYDAWFPVATEGNRVLDSSGLREMLDEYKKKMGFKSAIPIFIWKVQ